MWTILYQDEKLRKVLFDLGYGSYLVDASKRCDSMSNPAVSPWPSEAKLQDRKILLQLVQDLVSIMLQLHYFCKGIK